MTFLETSLVDNLAYTKASCHQPLLNVSENCRLLVCGPVCPCVMAGIVNMFRGASECQVLTKERESVQAGLLSYLLPFDFPAESLTHP